jgi:hypothetical protein
MMLEILQFYVSGFWVWQGITAGMAVALQALAVVAEVIIKAIKR